LKDLPFQVQLEQGYDESKRRAWRVFHHGKSRQVLSSKIVLSIQGVAYDRGS